MTNIQLLDLRHGSHCTYVAHRETVTRVHRQSRIRPEARSLSQRVDRSRIMRRMRVPTRVQLDGVRTEIA
jgi:hypothetical protein